MQKGGGWTGTLSWRTKPDRNLGSKGSEIKVGTNIGIITTEMVIEIRVEVVSERANGERMMAIETTAQVFMFFLMHVRVSIDPQNKRT